MYLKSCYLAAFLLIYYSEVRAQHGLNLYAGRLHIYGEHFAFVFAILKLNILQKFELYAFFSDWDCGVWLFLCSKVVKNCSRVVID